MVELKLDGIMMNVGETSNLGMEVEDDLSDMHAMGPSFFYFKLHPFLLVFLLQLWKHMSEVLDDLSVDWYNVETHLDYWLSY